MPPVRADVPLPERRSPRLSRSSLSSSGHKVGPITSARSYTAHVPGQVFEHLSSTASIPVDHWYAHTHTEVNKFEVSASKTLAKLSAVSRLFCRLTRPARFRQLRLSDKTLYRTMLEWLSDNPDAAASVEEIILSSSVSDDVNDGGSNCDQPLAVLDVFTLMLTCHKLSSIYIDAPSTSTFPWSQSFATIAHLPVLPVITALDLPFGHDSSTTTARLLAICPALTYLMLTRRTEDTNPPPAHQPLPKLHPDAKLQDFTLICTRHGDSPLAGLTTLFRCSSNHLTHLTLCLSSELFCLSVLLHMLEDGPRFPALEALQLLSVRTLLPAFKWVKLLNHCPNLQHLIIDFACYNDPTRCFEPVAAFGEALPELQCTRLLKSISLNTPGIFRADHFTFLRFDNLSSLQEIHLRSELLQRSAVDVPGLLGTLEQFTVMSEILLGAEVDAFMSKWDRKNCSVKIEMGRGHARPLWNALDSERRLKWFHNEDRTSFIEKRSGLYPDDKFYK